MKVRPAAFLPVFLLAWTTCAALSNGTFAMTSAKTGQVATAASIPRQAALTSIAALKATLLARRKAIDAAYDYFTVGETLRKTFQKNGVTDPAVLEYAKTWGPNIVYLTLDNLHGFYDYHLDQLHASELHIKRGKNPLVRKVDIEYLEQGMRSWVRAESQAATDMDLMADEFGRQAALLQQQREVQRQHDAAPPTAKRNLALRIEAVGEMAKHHRQLASEISSRLALVGSKTRLFSAINVADRIAADPCRENRGTDNSIQGLQAIELPQFAAPPVSGPAR